MWQQVCDSLKKNLTKLVSSMKVTVDSVAHPSSWSPLNRGLLYLQQFHRLVQKLGVTGIFWERELSNEQISLNLTLHLYNFFNVLSPFAHRFRAWLCSSNWNFDKSELPCNLKDILEWNKIDESFAILFYPIPKLWRGREFQRAQFTYYWSSTTSSNKINNVPARFWYLQYSQCSFFILHVFEGSERCFLYFFKRYHSQFCHSKNFPVKWITQSSLYGIHMSSRPQKLFKTCSKQ